MYLSDAALAMDIQGSAGNDILPGTGEADWMNGSAGSDLLVGNDGDDVLFGGDGDDAFRGGPGADLQLGGTGDDSFIIGGGGDQVFGNAGADTFIILPGGDIDIFPAETELTVDTATGQHRFMVELAETRPQMLFGLMFREDLAAGRGMLFDFGNEQPVSFFMKHTFIPLDLLFIDADGMITTIAERAVPLSEQTIPSGAPVRAVLEIPAGTASALGIHVGDQVLHPAFGTADPATAGGSEIDAPAASLPEGNDTIRDFVPSEDAIDLSQFGTLAFAHLDTNSDGVLDGGDSPVAITGTGDTVIRLPPLRPDIADSYTLTIAGVTDLTEDDFVFLA